MPVKNMEIIVEMAICSMIVRPVQVLIPGREINVKTRLKFAKLFFLQTRLKVAKSFFLHTRLKFAKLFFL